MYKRLTILTLVVIIFTTFMGTGANTESNLTTELKENLIPLKTVEAESGFEDLMPLKEILKDKRIIGMGEATHGTSEFFKMKHRMFEFLVEEMRYRVFAIEGEFGGSQVVNEYILYGKGDINQSLEAMNFWIWSTEEVVDMIEWMKKYNDDPNNKRKIKFYGFDIQSADNSLSYVLDYLEKVGSNNIDGYRKGIKTLEEIYAELMENRHKYIKNSSVEEYDLILQHAVIIDQCIDLQRSEKRPETRDYYMTENIKWILDYENKYYGNDKIMLWAHNGHIDKENIQFKSMGNNLKDIYNEGYYSLGFDFYEGSFVAVPVTFYRGIIGKNLAKFHIGSSPRGSYGYEMNKTGVPINFLDFKNATKNKVVSEFLSSKIHVNHVGATYFGKWHNVNPINRKEIKDSFDGMIFIKSTTEAKRTKSYIGEIQDGNKVLAHYYIFVAILAIVIFIILYKLSKKKKVISQQTEVSPSKFCTLEIDTDSNIIEKLIIKINNYFNSISTFRYCFIVLFIITILTVALNIIKPSKVFNIVYVDVGIRIITNLIFFILITITQIFLLYILPLNILKAFSKKKSINFNHILIVSTIMALINSTSYFSLGILLYFLSLLLSFIEGFIYCYTYGLLYYKGKKPLITITIILVIYNILIMLGVILKSKI